MERAQRVTGPTHEQQVVAHSTPALSVIVPLRNRRATIEQRYLELSAVLHRLGIAYEIIMVDDGSIDGSFGVLHDLATEDRALRAVRLRRRFGRSAALAAGFDRARGALIATIDADGQTDPDDLPLLLSQLDQGHDIVSGRRNRPRSSLTRVGNWLISRATGLHLRDYGCPLKLYRAEAIDDLHLYGDLYRFLPAIAYGQGARVAEVEVRERDGYASPMGGSLLNALGVVLDLITVHFLLRYSKRPMHNFGLLGGLMLVGSVGLAAYLGLVKFVGGQDIGDRPLLLLIALLVLVGIQFLVLGLLAELVVRLYYEMQQKPIYLVRDEIN